MIKGKKISAAILLIRVFIQFKYITEEVFNLFPSLWIYTVAYRNPLNRTLYYPDVFERSQMLTYSCLCQTQF
jgi:hypothetical protein